MDSVKLIKRVTSYQVQSILLENVFSEKYSNYIVTCNGKERGSQNAQVNVQLIDVNNNVITQGEYDSAGLQMKSYATPYDELRYLDQTAFKITMYARENFGGFQMFIYEPFNANVHTAITSMSTGNYSNNIIANPLAGHHDEYERATGVKLGFTGNSCDMEGAVYGIL